MTEPPPGSDRSMALGRLARSEPFLRHDLEGCLRAVTETAAALLGVARAGVWFFTPARDAILCRDLYVAATGAHETGLVLRAEDHRAYFAAIAEDRIVAAADAVGDPRTADFGPDYLIPFGIGAMLDAPIIHKGALVGIVCCEHAGGSRLWSGEDQTLAASLADFVALALAADEIRKAESRARAAEQRWRDLFENAVEGMFQMSVDGRLITVNPALARLLGFADPEVAKAALRDARSVFADPEVPAELDRRLPREKQLTGYEAQVLRQDGHPIWVSLNIRGIYGPDGKFELFEGSAQDITHRKRAEQQLAHVSLHDGLTALPNRTLFMDRLAQAMRRVRAGQAHAVTVFLIDCDNFRLVNNTLGHALADRMLVMLSRRLRAAIGPGDTLARLGGDDFGLLMEGPMEPEGAMRLAEELRQSISAPLELSGHDVFPSVSIAVATDGGEREHADDLLRDLGIAMHYSKNQGRGRCVAFEPRMRTAPLEALRMQTDLRRAIDRNELELAFQPIVDLRTGQLAGFEALVRWPGGARGPVPPAVFIPVAEECGLIGPLGAWILGAACQWMRGWQDRLGASPLSISVNVSPVQLARADLSDAIEAAVAQSGVDIRRVKLEVTETAFGQDVDLVSTRLAALRESGFRVIIDDFGTGYSSLSRLHRLPFDGLKIDQSFVQAMRTDSDCRDIVRSVIALGRSLGVEIVAEGVEDAETGRALLKLGCTMAQGYHFARPLTEAQADALLERMVAGPVSLPAA